MVVEPTHEWKICSSNWESFPQGSGWKFKKYEWNHHLVLFWVFCCFGGTLNGSDTKNCFKQSPQKWLSLPPRSRLCIEGDSGGSINRSRCQHRKWGHAQGYAQTPCPRLFFWHSSRWIKQVFLLLAILSALLTKWSAKVIPSLEARAPESW